MSAREVRALAVLIETEAERRGKEWPTGAIHAAVERLLHAGRAVEDVLTVALADARDPAQRGMRWALATPHGARCAVCSHPESACRRAAALVAPEHRHEYAPVQATPAPTTTPERGHE